MIGKHFVDIFRELKIEVNDFEHFISIYKSIYFDYINDSNLYPEVEETLKYLKLNGIKISLLTTKMQDQAQLIINYFNLQSSFDYIMGRRNGLTLKPSPEPLLYICKELGTTPSETLIVGDTELDIQCGKNAGAKTCGVLFGYRIKKLIENEKPDFIISSLSGLKRII